MPRRFCASSGLGFRSKAQPVPLRVQGLQMLGQVVERHPLVVFQAGQPEEQGNAEKGQRELRRRRARPGPAPILATSGGRTIPWRSSGEDERRSRSSIPVRQPRAVRPRNRHGSAPPAAPGPARTRALPVAARGHRCWRLRASGRRRSVPGPACRASPAGSGGGARSRPAARLPPGG